MILAFGAIFALATEGGVDLPGGSIPLDEPEAIADLPSWWDDLLDLDCGSPDCLDPDVNGLYDIDRSGTPVVRAIVFTGGSGPGFELWSTLPGFGANQGAYAGQLTLERDEFSFSADSAHAWGVLDRFCDWIDTHTGPVWWVSRGSYSAPVAGATNSVPGSSANAVSLRLLGTSSADYYLRLSGVSGRPPRIAFYEATGAASASGAFTQLEQALDAAPPCSSGHECLVVASQGTPLGYLGDWTVYAQSVRGTYTTIPFCSESTPRATGVPTD